jgi:hypothetical protein
MTASSSTAAAVIEEEDVVVVVGSVDATTAAPPSISSSVGGDDDMNNALVAVWELVCRLDNVGDNVDDRNRGVEIIVLLVLTKALVVVMGIVPHEFRMTGAVNSAAIDADIMEDGRRDLIFIVNRLF